MKRLIISFFLSIIYFSLIAQTGSIVNIEVSQRTDGSGIVDIKFDLIGQGESYNILLEVLFNEGEYVPVPMSSLNGDLKQIAPGVNKLIQWDGLTSFPDTYSANTRLKIIAAEINKTGPTVSTLSASLVSQTTAVLNGNVSEDGGSPITERGFYWSKTNINPDLGDNKVVVSGTTGNFSKDISGLQPNTTYYYVAFASNAQGTSKGLVENFTTENVQELEYGTLTDTRGGETKVYKTIVIGEQEWMAENLAYLPSVSLPSQGSGTSPYYYVLGYEGTDVVAAKQHPNYITFGVLYNWPAAMAGAASSSANPSEVQGVCPAGWHMPSDAEWTQLENYLADNGYNYDGTIGGGSAKIAKSLAATILWPLSTNNGTIGNDLSQNNKSGFSALPGGYLNYGSESFFGNGGIWWSSTQFGSTTAWARQLTFLSEGLHRFNSTGKTQGYSVRCIKGEGQQVSLPTITTVMPSNITSNSAKSGGNITSDGGAPVTARGVVWNTSDNPTLDNKEGMTLDGTGTGSFESDIKNLSPKTTYYVRAYATNSAGTQYGNKITLTTLETITLEYGTLTDTRGGETKVYKTIIIGEQEWMAENLAYLPAVSPLTQGSDTSPYYYVYDYDGDNVVTAKATNNYITYGVLYNWSAAITACPSDWHLPTDADWNQLENFLANNGYNYDGSMGGGSEKIAKSMASTTIWKTSSNVGSIGNNLSENNKSGFSGLPGGFLDWDGYYIPHSILEWGGWFSSTESDWGVLVRGLYNSQTGLINRIHPKNNGMSVRCVKGNFQQASLPTVTTTALSSITSNSAKSGGEITSDGGAPVIERGVVWNTTENPSLESNTGITMDGTGTGSFESELKNLSVKTTYYVRAYATNSMGTEYGNQVTFTTSESVSPVYGTMTDTRGGEIKVYKTVIIGEQEWMAENLAYLPAVSPPLQSSESDNLYYVYGYVGSDIVSAKQNPNYNTFGVLYNWPAALSACPADWHLPSDAEWEQLENYLADNGYNYDGTIGGGRQKIAKSVAASILWDASSNIGSIGNILLDNNKSGFSALPGGIVGDGGHYHLSYEGHYWSSTTSENSLPWHRYLDSGYAQINRSGQYPDMGISVRCMKNAANQASKPILNTVTPFGVTSNSAKSGGDIISDGGAPVIERGVVWNTTENPSLESNTGITMDGTGTGSFESELKNLSAKTTYYVRAYATNSMGTEYGNQVAFTTSELAGPVYKTMTDTRGGETKVYKTVVIGEQEWMAENLAYLPSVSPSSEGSKTAPFYYIYDYQGTDLNMAKQSVNYTSFGVLYNWPAAMAGATSSTTNPSNVQGVCPTGWHLPSDAEWTQLENYLIANGYNYDGTTTGNKIAKSMAATTNWNSSSVAGAIGNNISANNKSGFSAMPSGCRMTESGWFHDGGFYGLYWSSTEPTSLVAWYRQFFYEEPSVGRYGWHMDQGLSVRCVKD